MSDSNVIYAVPEGQCCIEDQTTFVFPKELDEEIKKISSYKFIDGTVLIEDFSTSETVYDSLTWEEGRVSQCWSQFLLRPPEFFKNVTSWIYISPIFQSNATIKLPDGHHTNWTNYFYLQFSKIDFKINYGSDEFVLHFSPDVDNTQEWFLDTFGDADPAYNRESSAEISFTSKEIRIELKDGPKSEIRLHYNDSPLTSIIRNQDFLVFLAVESDNNYKILHSLKWYIRFKWTADRPDESHHEWGILPNEVKIPIFDIKNGTCNTNQYFFLNGYLLPTEESVSRSHIDEDKDG